MKIWNSSIRAAVFLVAVLAGQAFADEAPKPLISGDGVQVTSDDFEGYLLRLPAENRPEARSSYQWIGTAVDTIFENRVLAAEARKKGYDKNPEVIRRLKQMEETYLASLWAERYRDGVAVPDLSRRAEEIFVADREKYTVPERVSLTHILITLNGRTRDAARQLAEEVHKRIVAGESFDALAAAHSEDKNFPQTKGRIEGVSRSDIERPIADAVFALKSPGDVTQPVETHFGFHVVRLDGRTRALVRPFKDVEDSIKQQEVERLRGEALAKEVGRLKAGVNPVVNLENINALRVGIDPGLIERAHQEAFEQQKRMQEALKLNPAPATSPR